MKILFIGSRLFDDVNFYLKEKKIESILTESNSKASNLGMADTYFIVSRGMDEPIEIAKKYNVDGIIPLIGIDDPLMDVAIAKEKIESELKIPFIASNINAIEITSDKIKTKEFFQKNGFDTSNFQVISRNIKTSNTSNNTGNNTKNNTKINTKNNTKNINNDVIDAINQNIDSFDSFDFVDSININFPVVLKQRSGQGGRDIAVVNDIDETKKYLSEFEEALCEEFIEGSEISIEVLGYNGEYIPLVPVYKGETTFEGLHPLSKVRSAPAEIQGLDNDYVRYIAYKIAKELNAEGTIDIDFIFSKDDKKLYALEINSRPSGTRYLTAAASGIHPLTKLIDMVSGDFNIKSIENEMKDYFAIEVPIGGYDGPKSSEPLKKFTKNSWVVHGPPNYERITISGESKDEAKKLSKKLLKNSFDDFKLDNI